MNEWLQAILPFIPFGGNGGSSPSLAQQELASDPLRGGFLREMDREYPSLIGKQNPQEVQKLEQQQQFKASAAKTLKGAAQSLGTKKPNLPAPGTKDEVRKKAVQSNRPKVLPALRDFLAAYPSVTSRLFTGF